MVTATLALLFAAHLPLLGLGHWVDEFETFAWYRAASTDALYERVVNWGPRPVSEVLIFLYFLASEATRRPLFAPVLGLAWLAFVAPSLAACVILLRRLKTLRAALLRANIALTLPVLTILFGGLTDVFLWPMSAIAYLPAAGCLIAVALIILHGSLQDARSWLAMAVLGTCAAASVEMAALVALILFPLLGAVAVQRRTGPPPGLIVLCCSAPTLCAGLVMLAIATHRARSGSPLTADHVLVHRAWPSLVHALPIFGREMLGAPASIYLAAPPQNVIHCMALIAYALGCLLLGDLLGPNERSVRAASLLAVGAAVAAACYLSVALTLYQFGVMCCERQDVFRTCMELLGLTCLATWLAGRLFRVGRWRDVAPARHTAGVILTCAGCLLLAPERLIALDRVIVQRGRLEAAIEQSWQSGWDRSASGMTYYVIPPGLIIGHPEDWTGTHDRAAATDHWLMGVMDYFEKRSVTFSHLPPVA